MTVYDVICPKCGQAFQIAKGATMLELRSGKILPKSREESEPDFCPECHCRVSVNDPDFSKYVKSIMMID